MAQISARSPVVSVVVLAALCTAIAGCSSSKKTPSSEPPSSSSSATLPSSPTPSEQTSSTAIDKAHLAAITLKDSDLPAGWTSAAPSPNTDDAAAQAQMATCLGVRNTFKDSVDEAQSQDYTMGDATISSDATSFRSQADIDNDVAMLKRPKIDSCYAKLVRAEAGPALPAGTKITAVSVHVTPGGEPSNVAATVTGKLTVSVSGQTVVVYDDTALISGPRIEAEVDFENVGAPIPATLQKQLIAKVAARAARG